MPLKMPSHYSIDKSLVSLHNINDPNAVNVAVDMCNRFDMKNMTDTKNSKLWKTRNAMKI